MDEHDYLQGKYTVWFDDPSYGGRDWEQLSDDEQRQIRQESSRRSQQEYRLRALESALKTAGIQLVTIGGQ